MEYKKTKEDVEKEQADLKSSPIMRFLLNREHLQFSVGDILIKQTKSSTHVHMGAAFDEEGDWKTEVVSSVTGAPRKYMYVFENELGIGYVKQLMADGSGLSSTALCVASVDPRDTRYILDPEYVDHLLLSDDKDSYVPNADYIAKKKFREEAMAKNKAMMVKTGNKKELVKWYESLKVGDEFWMGWSMDQVLTQKYKITSIKDKPKDNGNVAYYRDNALYKESKIHREITINQISGSQYGSRNSMHRIESFMRTNISMTQLYPLKDPMCDNQK